MLESVDVLKGARESLRRVVRIPCDLVSETFDEPVELEITDLCADGAFVETNLALEDGEELDIAFEVPRTERLLAVRARVCRAALHRRRVDARLSGMGLEFIGLGEGARAMITEALRGLPPRLPVKGPATPGRRMRKAQRGKKMLWVDALHDWGGEDPVSEIDDAIDGAIALTTLHLG